MKIFRISELDAPQLLKDYLSYMLTIRGRSQRTVNGYYIDIRFFLRFIRAISENLSFDEKNLNNIKISDMCEDLILNVTLTDAFDFLNFTITENDNNANTRSRKVSSIRGFYKYITEKTNKLSANPLENLEAPKKKISLPKYLSLEDSLSLLNNINGNFYERDYAIITFFLNCGMRVSELVDIKLQSFQDENKLRLLGKGNKERIVYLNDACLDAKRKYDIVRKKQLKDKKCDYYFLSKNCKKLTTRRIEQLLANHLKTAGLSDKGISPHKLRHTAATLMYQYGNVDIRVLQEILGHVNLNTTEIYTHVSGEQLEKAIQSSPLSNVHNNKNNED